MTYEESNKLMDDLIQFYPDWSRTPNINQAFTENLMKCDFNCTKQAIKDVFADEGGANRKPNLRKIMARSFDLKKKTGIVQVKKNVPEVAFELENVEKGYRKTVCWPPQAKNWDNEKKIRSAEITAQRFKHAYGGEWIIHWPAGAEIMEEIPF